MSIELLTRERMGDVGKCDGAFTVDSKLVLSARDNVVSYEVVPVAPYEKRYAKQEIDYGRYVGAEDRAVYLAYIDGVVAGEMRLWVHWNGFAYIDDIVVDRGYRRRGVGRALIEQAVGWAKAKGLAGVMLETQDNNVGACRLYEACGFVIGGFDRKLYRGIPGVRDEVAVYWYREG